MTVVGSSPRKRGTAARPDAPQDRRTTIQGSTERPRVEGKYLAVEGERFFVKGVTYGTFMPNANGELFPERERVRADFREMRRAAVNTVRTYVPPPEWLLDLADAEGIKIIVGIYWEGRRCCFEDEEALAAAQAAVREAVRSAAGHPAVLMYCLGNEIPPLIPRWHGKEKVERFIRSLYDLVKALDPDALVTYANYPPTEFLDLSFLDVLSFNVYLEREPEFRAYLARLQALAGDRPLLLSEMGLDTYRGGLEAQAQILDWQLRAVFEKGLCGATVYAWTDEWAVGGKPIEDWKFGLVDAERRAKPALARVRAIYESDLIALRRTRWPRVSVVVASYNGGYTLPECLESLLALNYPKVEIIVVDDGSTDGTREMLERYPVRTISVPNGGLSRARNLGIQAATGEIVAFTDSDCRVDPDWLTHLVLTLEEKCAAAVGGPNLPPPEDGWVAQCVARAPGNPVHVLLDNEVAEHIPGCNMAYRKEALEAIDGFNPVYTAAGDDVDVCWKLLDREETIAFSPTAIVWHHRRPTLKGYLRQQRGYGRAEALLEERYPERFNPLGYATWRGHVYDTLHQAVMSGGLFGWLRPRVYHGRFGEGLFQSVYQPALTWWFQIFSMFEWQVGAATLVAAAGLSAAVWHPALWAVGPMALGAVGATLCSVVGAARLSCRDAGWRGWERLRNETVVALMHLLQPLARGVGRLARSQKSKVKSHEAKVSGIELVAQRGQRSVGGCGGAGPRDRPFAFCPLPFDFCLASEARFWDGCGARAAWLRRLSEKLTRHGYAVQFDQGWEPWDLCVRASAPFTAHLTSVVEMETVLRYRCTVRPRRGAYLLVAAAVAFLLALLQAPVLLPLAIPLLGMLVRLQRSQVQLAAALHQLADQAAGELEMVALEENE